MRFCHALILVLVASPVFAQAPAVNLTLPERLLVDHKPGKLIKIDAKTNASKVAWSVLRNGIDVDAIPSNTSITLGMPGPASVFFVIAAASGADGQAVIAQCRVEVQGAPPSPSPTPNPGPVVKQGIVKHCTLLVANKSAVTTLADRMGPELERRGIQLYVLSPDEADADFKQLRTQAGGDCVILQDADGNVVNGQVFRLSLSQDAARDAGSLLDAIDRVNQ